MLETQHAITYAGKSIPFHLSYSNRKSIEIAVHPNGLVTVKAPEETDKNLIQRRVYKRARWIRRQIRYFAQFDPRTPERRFVGGESHLYLGKKYRLKIRQAETDKVLLKHGFFHIATVNNEPEHIAILLEEWYRSKANIYFLKVFEECWYPFHKKVVDKPTLKIRNMKTRWGSLSSKGSLTLNLELIKAPRECIEYVVIHELCHLFHPNHGAEFYNLLERMLPDWIKRKHKLEMSLS